MTRRLSLLLISLWLGHAAAQTAPAAKPNNAPAASPAAAAPAAGSAAVPATAAKPAAPQAATPTVPATPAPAAASQPAAPAAAANADAAKTDPAPAPKPTRKGKAEEAPPPPPKPSGPLKRPTCTVADFRAIGMDNTDEQARRAKASAWLKKFAPNCTAEQLIVIRNNRSQWLGSADSAALAAMVDGLLESFAETNRDVSILLYGTPPPPPKPNDGKGNSDTSSAAAKK